jgi:hypothetical protein
MDFGHYHLCQSYAMRSTWQGSIFPAWGLQLSWFVVLAPLPNPFYVTNMGEHHLF